MRRPPGIRTGGGTATVEGIVPYAVDVRLLSTPAARAADPEQAFCALLAGGRHELTAFEDACPGAGTAVRELGQPRGWLRHCARRGETPVCFHR
ncbi:hypothetical protein [Nocardia farcinica]|uniref:hypothetical protein n=1 Tax=Nocardia farcinica TaxID=37329 RepID=UPI001895C1FF|nr:hypothetical protein [Nocardia farcinica]